MTEGLLQTDGNGQTGQAEVTRDVGPIAGSVISAEEHLART